MQIANDKFVTVMRHFGVDFFLERWRHQNVGEVSRGCNSRRLATSLQMHPGRIEMTSIVPTTINNRDLL